MNAQTLIVGWKDVRNHELSDIITRRQAVGLLGADLIDALVNKWATREFVPGDNNGAASLAKTLEEWLDVGLLTPASLRATVGRWENVHRAEPIEASLTDEQCQDVLQRPLFQELAAVLRPRDWRDAVAALPDDRRKEIQRRWQEKGWVLPQKNSKPGDFENLDQFARENLRAAMTAHKAERIRALLENRGDLFASLPVCSPGAATAMSAESDSVVTSQGEVHAHPDDTEAQAYEAVRKKEWLPPHDASADESLALNALILEALLRREVSSDLVGLALSGGGIRSASFNLGLLQALQKDKLVRDLDYLSTVSGGGYVGSFFSSMVHTQDVHLNPKQDKEPPIAPASSGKQPEQVVKLVRSGSFLNHPLLHASRYLLGVFLNNLVLLSALIAVCTVVAGGWRFLDTYPVEAYIRSLSDGWVKDWNRPFLPAFVVLLIWFLISAAYLAIQGPQGHPRIGHWLLVLSGFCVLVGAAVALATPNLDVPLLNSSTDTKPAALLPISNIPAGILLVVTLFGLIPFLRPWRFLASGTQPSGPAEQLIFRLLSILLLGGIPFFLVYLIARHDIAHELAWGNDTSARTDLHESDIQYNRWPDFWTRLIQQATQGDEKYNMGRSVWARLKNVQEDIRASIDDKTLQQLPIPLDAAVRKKKQEIIDAINHDVIRDKGFTEDVLGKPGATSNATEAKIRKRSERMREGARLRSLLDRYHEGRLIDEDKYTLNRLMLEAYYGWAIWERAVVRRSVVIEQDQQFRWLLLGVTALLALGSSLVVGLNATSLHGIYSQQLAWLYLTPVAQPKAKGYLRLHELNTTGKGAPYHLILASLDKGSEQVEGTRPTVQFLFSPGYCGSIFTGFVATKDYQPDDEGGTLDLATAMAISGAAFSPARVDNRLIAFLMLVLNVRLGQWLPSPRYPARVRCLPMLRLIWSLVAFRGVDRRRFWFVTDGGHSENLGLGPLLRRECKLIIVSDAGYDPDYGFDDFVQLYRHARTQGVRFQTLDQSGFIRMDPLMPDKATGISPHHYIVARIEYPGPENKWGLLIYVKPSFAGDEAVDLQRYRRVNANFPHDPTVNQWFSEDQVESYRELGAWIGQQVSQALKAPLRDRGKYPFDFDEIVKAIEMDVKQRAAARAERTRSDQERLIETLAATLQAQLKGPATAVTGKPPVEIAPGQAGNAEPAILSGPPT